MSAEDKTKLDGLNNYTLPTASASTLGGIKVGQNLAIDASGVLSAEGYKYYPSNKSFKTIAQMTSTSLINKYSEEGNIIDLPSGKAEGFIFGSRNVLKTGLSTIVGKNNTIDYNVLQPSQPSSNVVVGDKNTVTDGNDAAVFGTSNTVTGGVGVYSNNGSKPSQFAAGVSLNVNNAYESALGQHNISHIGDSEATRTRLSIGGGCHRKSSTVDDAENFNIIELMQNDDVYVYGVGGYDGVHIKSETGYESTKTLQEYISSIETSIAGKQSALTEGTGIDIASNVISVDTSVIQAKMSAGEGIAINNNVITATGGGAYGTHTTYMFSDSEAAAGTYSQDIQNFYQACITNQDIQDVAILVEESYVDPVSQENTTSLNYYYPSAERIYEGNVELWLLYTEDCVTWENRYYLITPSTVTRTITTGSFGSSSNS